MKRSAESSPSQDPITTPVEVQILNQGQAENMGIKDLKFTNDREVVAFRRDGKDQILEAKILQDIDKSKFLHDDDCFDEALLEGERALKDSGK
jgi:hypothetical protein